MMGFLWKTRELRDNFCLGEEYHEENKIDRGRVYREDKQRPPVMVSVQKKKGNSGRDRAVKSEGEVAGNEGGRLQLHLGHMSEPGKSCCCLSLLRL
jgi:hypothetical protein